MWRCCKREGPEQGTHSLDAGGPPMLFPMWVLPISTFLSMSSGAPKSHQELKEEGKLVQWQSGT